MKKRISQHAFGLSSFFLQKKQCVKYKLLYINAFLAQYGLPLKCYCHSNVTASPF